MRRRRLLPLLFALLLVGSGLPSGPARAATYPALFGTKEIESGKLDIFPKWTGMLERYFDERKLAEGSCDSATFNRCRLHEWSAFLETLRGRDAADMLDAVNRYLNQAAYIIDIVNYGVEDYWATPRQFLGRDGDCEDYAIAKFMSLRALGFPDDRLRIVVLEDLNLGIGHAVLAVYSGQDIEILDNQVETVVPASRIHHYKPLYSINESHWWLHRPL